MRYGDFIVRAPLLLGGETNDAEALGAAVWLWMHSARHRGAQLQMLPAVLLPAIVRQQYVLVQRQDRPVFFLSWAWMSEAAEQRYLTDAVINLPEEDWCSGERLWFRDFIAPFGHAAQMFHLLREELFPKQIARALWHRGDEKGRRIKTFYGNEVNLDVIRQWKQANPPHE